MNDSELPRFESKTTELEITEQSDSIDRKQIRLLPRFQSDYQRKLYDENQSAEKTTSRTWNFSGKFLERAYDRSGKKCWPMINTNIGKFDLEHTYDVAKDALESYIHYRKLDRCKALSNFIEYRNKVYKRMKTAQYASSELIIPTTNIPKKIVQIEQETPSLPSSSMSDADSSTQSLISEKSHTLSTPTPSIRSMSPKTSPKPSSLRSMVSKQSLVPPKPIPPSRSMSPNTSQRLSPASTKESIIPIPSPDLLKRPISKSSKISTSKKMNSNIKQPSSSSSIKASISPKKLLSKSKQK